MKKSLGFLCLFLAVAACSQARAIMIDGDISDWPKANVFTDPGNDVPNTNTDISHWGAWSDGVNLYTFVELNPIRGISVADFMTGEGLPSGSWSRCLEPGLRIDADRSNTTVADTLDPAIPGLDGLDINWQWNMAGPGNPSPENDLFNQFYFWGHNGYEPGGAWDTASSTNHAYNGHIIEYKCSLATLGSELRRDGVTLGPAIKVAMALQGNDRTGSIAWGYDTTAPVTISLLPGDADMDGVVSFADFTVVQNNYGKDVGLAPDGYQMGDFNGDRKITFEDFVILQNNYGAVFNAGAPSAPMAPAPEPISIALLGLGALGLRRRS